MASFARLFCETRSNSKQKRSERARNKQDPTIKNPSCRAACAFQSATLKQHDFILLFLTTHWNLS
eukprot:2308890-Pleurochrysis_carterae.AAC.2